MLIQVPPEGPLDCRIAFVGEAPGEREVVERRPFVGWTGKHLDSLLAAVGILRHTCYITNVVKVRPQGNDISIYIKPPYKDKEPKPTSEYYAYVELLHEELNKCSANVIVPLGNVALYATTGKWGITTWRGSLMRSVPELGCRKILPTLHPASALRRPEWDFYIQADLHKIAKESSSPEILFPQRNLTIYPDINASLAYMRHLLQQPEGTEIGFDIETFDYNISCLSFALTPDDAISIPFTYQHGDYFLQGDEEQVWLAVAGVLEAPHLKKVLQNAIFDFTYIYNTLGVVIDPIEDTMIAQAILDPDLDKGLDTLASLFSREPYYKGEGKAWFKRLNMNIEDFWRYNAKDAAVTLECWQALKGECLRRDQWPVYRRHVDLIKPLVLMTHVGARVDVDGMNKEARRNKEELNKLQAELTSIVGPETDEKFANSPKQLMKYFYETKKYKPRYRTDPKTKQRKLTSDVYALKELERVEGDSVARIIRKMRHLTKITSSYLEAKLDEDNRLRCSYNPVGARTGRISSSGTLGGTGLNRQTIPQTLKRYFLADDGYLAVTADLSQAETRVVAAWGPVPRMQHAFETGIDIHRLTASLIFDIPYDEVSDEDGSSPLGDGAHSQRHWAKQANHALSYGLGHKKFAMRHELSDEEAYRIVQRHHVAYPEIRSQFQRRVREEVMRTHMLKNPMGRKRRFLALRSLLSIGDDAEGWEQAYAHIPQSTVADIINEWGVNVIYYDTSGIYSPIMLLNQVHDSIEFQFPLDIGSERIADILSALSRSLERPITLPLTTLLIPVDISIGFCFSKKLMINIKSPFTQESINIAIASARKRQELSNGAASPRLA